MGKSQKFHKKPVVIEAVQWNPHAKPTDMPKWLWDELTPHPQLLNNHTQEVFIRKLEMIARPGDWIIKGIKGELYACKPDIFEATYEAAE